jgi:NAD(P)-dependent dehydrogenase (short-subunit alcohol dehydrogenase family)
MSGLFSIAGKCALVTGGTAGIGRMIAAAYVDAGATVYLCARDDNECHRVSAELVAGPGSSAGGACIPVAGDVSTEGGCRTVAEHVADREDHLDILVNNAGGSWTAPVEAFGDEGWDRVLAVNLKGPFFLSRFLLPLLRKAARPDDPARIINIGSVSASRIPDMDNYSYTASKAALQTMTRHLARRLAPEVTVNAIAPGPFPSRMMAELLESQADRIAAAAPMGRIGRPSDIAGGAIYLASPAASWVTGTLLTIDGGLCTT